MGKEIQLLEAAAAGNNTKVENILKGKTNALKRWLSKEKLDEEGEVDGVEGSESNSRKAPIITNKQVSPHVDVNCTDEQRSTPLILASLNGHRDVASTLLQYSANVKATDAQGNTALHMAAWQNRSEIVELLLVNGADCTKKNKQGNTPLHFACQHCPPGKTLTIIKLLQHHADILTANNSGDTPLDLAIQFNKQEAVAMLVDADPHSLKDSKIIINAAKTGRQKVVEILLEAGMDPNSTDTATGSLPLHEAVTFFRKDVAALLVSFGAQPGVKNGQGKSAIDIIQEHPPAKQEEFMKIFRENRGKRPRVARAQLETEQQKQVVATDSSPSFAHTIIKTRSSWLKDTADHCSAFTKKHPCTSLVDHDPCSYWLVPAAGAYNWVAFDLGSEYTLTGVRLYGWGNKKMVYTFDIEVSSSLSGPWEHVSRYQAEMEGPEDMEQPSHPQDFKGFYTKTRYIKLVIADNYGDTKTALSSIEFFGIENVMIELFKKLELVGYIKAFAEKRYNQLSDICILSDEALSEIIKLPAHRSKLITIMKKLRVKYYPPANLSWGVKPVDKITAGKVMPHFSVVSDPYTVGELVLIVHGGAEIKGNTRVHLLSKNTGYISKANFPGISLSPAGSYFLEVQSATDPSVSLMTNEAISVVPPPKRDSEVDLLFKGFEEMLNF